MAADFKWGESKTSDKVALITDMIKAMPHTLIQSIDIQWASVDVTDDDSTSYVAVPMIKIIYKDGTEETPTLEEKLAELRT